MKNFIDFVKDTSPKVALYALAPVALAAWAYTHPKDAKAQDCTQIAAHDPHTKTRVSFHNAAHPHHAMPSCDPVSHKLEEDMASILIVGGFGM